MNEDAAYALIDAEVGRLRQWPYSELIKLVDAPEAKLVMGEDGNSYNLEIEALWDSAEGGDVRVMVIVDDGKWWFCTPLTGDFIKRPDGSYVDEFPAA
jgi:hypothetical protein